MCMEPPSVLAISETPPLIEAFINTLQQCREKQDLVQAMHLQLEVCNTGLDTHFILGNQLVPLFVSCGNLKTAQQSFSRLVYRTNRSFASLMLGYVDHGDSECVFDLFHEMQQECLQANDYAFVALLKACSRLRDLQRGMQVHFEILKEGYESNPYINNTLIDMYAHCNSLEEAHDAFNSLGIHDAISWNALISGYVYCSQYDQALQCLDDMEFSGVLPNLVTYICGIKSCSELQMIELGQGIHCKVVEYGFEEDTSLGNTLVDMYNKCGLIAEAEYVFSTLPYQTVVSWNALISGYIEHGFYEKALICFEQMDKEGLPPDATTYISILKACSCLGKTMHGQDIHARIIKTEWESSIIICNSLVDMYAQLGWFLEAKEVSRKMQSRDVFTWTSLVTGYVAHGFVDNVIDCIQQMQSEGISPNVVSWSAAISGYSDQGESEYVFLAFARMLEEGVLPNGVTFLSILKSCGEAAALSIGKKVHAQLSNFNYHHEVNETTMQVTLIDMYARCGSLKDAQQVFNTAPNHGLVEWNTLLNGYARHGANTHVLCSLEKMKDEGVRPDEISFLSALSVCSHSGLVLEGLEYFKLMSEVYGIPAIIKHHTCLVDLYSRAGQLGEAVAILQNIPSEPDLVIWTPILAACRKTGDIEFGRQAFDSVVNFDKEHSASFLSMQSIYAEAYLEEEGT